MDTIIETNLLLIKERIKKACERVGRDPLSVTLLPVSKTKPTSDIRHLFSHGFKRFGENKVQEAMEKFEETLDLDIDWCIIGHLQTNKAKYVARFAKELHSLDRLNLAKELDKYLQKEGRSLDVLIQVNTSSEPQKYGIAPKDVLAFADELKAFKSLNIKGLMSLALFSSDEKLIRPCFARLKKLQELLRQKSHLNTSSWDVLSMGMSGDLEIAIEEGATEIRVGQGIFGARDLPDSYYWPNLKINK